MRHTPSAPFSRHGDLTTGSLRGHLLRLSLPMVWGILAIVSFQLVDIYYISLLGTVPLAAISFTLPVTMTVFSLIIGLGIGLSSVLARRIGAGNHHDVVRITTHGLILAGGITLAIGVAGIAAIGPLFRVMGADDTMMPMIRDYMTIWFAGAALIAIPVAGNAAMRAAGDSLNPSINMTLAALLNGIISPFLVFGLAGLPRLEVQGAAIATVISYALTLGMSLFVLHLRKRMLLRGGMEWSRFGDSARAILSVGLPAGIAALIQPMTQAVMIAIMAGYGAQAVAAFGVATRVEAMAFVIIMALAAGMAPILGQNFGAGQHDRVRATLRMALFFCAGWSVLVAAGLGLFAMPLAGIFSTDPAVVQLAALYFLIVPFSYALGNLAQGWGSALNALGQPRRAATIVIVRMIVLQIPAAIIAGEIWGPAGIFAAIAAVNVIAGAFVHINEWKRLKGSATPMAAAQNA